MHIIRENLKFIYKDLQDTVNHLSYSGTASKLGLKIALACIVSILVSLSLNLGHSYWAGFTAMIVMQHNIARSIKLSWLRLIGICIGSALGCIVVIVASTNYLAITFMMFILLTLIFYFRTHSKYEFSWLIIGLTTCLVVMLNINTPLHSIYTAFSWGANVTTGIIVSLLVNLIAFPNLAQNQLRKKSYLFRLLYLDLLKSVIQQYESGNYKKENIHSMMNELLQSSVKIKNLLIYTKYELILNKRTLLSVSLFIEELFDNLSSIWELYLSITNKKKVSLPSKYKNEFTFLIKKPESLIDHKTL